MPVAPTASAMNSSGIMTPSKKSGALPTTTASMSSKVDPESASARSMASRTRPFIETSWRLATYLVCPVPRTAASSGSRHRYFPSRTATRFCCSAGPLVACASTRLRRAVEDVLGGEADALQAGREHRVGGQRATRRVDLRRRRQPDGLGEDQLLMGERRVAARRPRSSRRHRRWRPGRRRRRRRRGQVAGAQDRGLDAVLDTGDPGRVLAQFAGLVAGGQHDRRRHRR